MADVFRLLVSAVAAIALLYIIYSYSLNPSTAPEEQFRKGLDYAEALGGKSYKYELVLQGESGQGAPALDTLTRSVRFECNETGKCEGTNIKVEPRFVAFTSNTLVDAYFRCVDKGALNDCVVYFGEEPAQLEIVNVRAEEKVTAGANQTASFEIRNTGKLDAIGSKWEIKVYSKSDEGGKENLMLKKEFSGEIRRLQQGEANAILQQFMPESSGEYVMKIMVSGEDAGLDSAETEFEALGGVSAQCSATVKGTPVIESGKCVTKYECSGCDTGAECKIRWLGKGVAGSSVSEVYPEGIYVESEAADGRCG